MKIALCSIRNTLLFGASSVLMLANGPAQSASVTTLFAMGELGATGFLCSLIMRQYRRKAMADSAMAAVAGYTVSHIGILTFMYFGFGSPGANSPAQGTLLWMELTLRVGLVVVLTSSAFVLMKPLMRKFKLPRLRKITTTAAGDYVI